MLICIYIYIHIYGPLIVYVYLCIQPAPVQNPFTILPFLDQSHCYPGIAYDPIYIFLHRGSWPILTPMVGLDVHIR